MTTTRDTALDWIRSYRNFPQLYNVGLRGFPIGRTTVFPIEDDWSIDATGYRGNARVRQIARDPHVEVLWIDTRGQWTRLVRIRGLAYHTDSDTLIRVYNHREDISRARGEGYGERRQGQAIIDAVCCTHITPQRVVAEGFEGPGSSASWTVDPASLRPAPPTADGSEPQHGPTGFRQPLEMTITEVSAKALAWARSLDRPQHLVTVQGGFPTGCSVPVCPHDDWTTDVLVTRDSAAAGAVAADARVEISWIEGSHDAGKDVIPTIVFLRGVASVLDAGQSADALKTLRQRSAVPITGDMAVIRVRPTRIRTEGFGQGLQMYAWNL